MVRPPSDGIASWYTDAQTASGERLRPWAKAGVYQCASPDEPMGVVLRVCHGASCIVCRVVDRGPNRRLKRTLDLTPVAFRELAGSLNRGLIPVTIDRE